MSTTTHSPADRIATLGAPDSGSEMLARARDALAQHDEAIGAMTRCSDDAAAALRIKERADVALQGHWSAIDHASHSRRRNALRPRMRSGSLMIPPYSPVSGRLRTMPV
jgi:hypothetical protein